MDFHLKRFDQLFVVSDLHMGGEKTTGENFQVFTQGKRLAAFIRAVAGRQSGSKDVALVLNGDVFDSLAEKELGGRYIALDVAAIERMMNRLYRDRSFQPVWEALAGFVRKAHCHLIILVGNHDIELALPPTQHSLRDRLCGDDPGAQSRLQFSAQGAGFGCFVGKARVFCTHGNELDEWNRVDYDALSQLANAMNAGRFIDPGKWRPNAGTRLVVHGMNFVKEQYPFVDLLKPENAATAMVLNLLDSAILKKLEFRDALPLPIDYIRGQISVSNLLGVPGETGLSGTRPATDREISDRMLGSNLKAALEKTSVSLTEDEILTSAAERQDDYEFELESGDEETLSARAVTYSLLSRIGILEKKQAMRAALLDWLKDDRTYELEDKSDPYFLGMEHRASKSNNFVITGHTHLARAMDYGPNRYYFNSGTWIRMIRLTTQSLADDEAFTTLWETLQSPDMSVLDDAEIPAENGSTVPLVLDRTTAVHIADEGKKVAGRLLEVPDAVDNPNVLREFEVI